MLGGILVEAADGSVIGTFALGAEDEIAMAVCATVIDAGVGEVVFHRVQMSQWKFCLLYTSRCV